MVAYLAAVGAHPYATEQVQTKALETEGAAAQYALSGPETLAPSQPLMSAHRKENRDAS